ncbi:MAG: response regulator [Desulfarculaceae bacterium]|jgi:CheY-like chemotaxis protein
MSVINIMSGSFCQSEEVAQGVASKLNYTLLRDEDLIGQLAREGGPEAGALRRAMYGRPSIFNQFSHDKPRAVSSLKLGVARLLENQDLVFLGHAALLMPREVRHILNVCLIAETPFRTARAARELGLNQKEAQTRVHRDDEAAFRWAEYVWDAEPWQSSLYDILLPMDQTPPEQALELICENAASQTLAPSEAWRRQVGDFQTTARVERVLAEAGHDPKDAEVHTHEGVVTILINKKVIRLGRLEEELKRLAQGVEGVAGVKVEPGPGFYKADVYRRVDFQLPSRVLLVDDEREFAQTLSERLMLREIGSAVVYDGEEALRVVAEDEPEVIVLDLKMPGIDGEEVLRRIKRDHPEVEVIILTGHGSERDKELCLQLGAFAYLEKPVDIDRLSQTMQQAYDKIKKQRG